MSAQRLPDWDPKAPVSRQTNWDVTGPKPTVSDRFVSVQEAARYASYSIYTIYRWIRIGQIPAYGPTNGLRVRLSDVLRPYQPDPNKAKNLL